MENRSANLQCSAACIPNRWYNVGIEFFVPDNAAEAYLCLSADQEASYWWDALKITQVDTSLTAIRQFWEERIATYGQVYTGLVVDARGLVWAGA